MALFENFPYTNLHDLNLDWVLGTIRKLIAEWAAYQVAMNDAFADLSGKFDDLRSYVMNYFENLDLDEAVTEAVRAVLETMIEDGTITELIAEYIKNIGGGGSVSVNLLAEYLTDTLQNSSNWFSSEHYEHAPQGCCYIGNDRVVLYVLTKPNTDNMGVLICIDIRTGTIVWKSNRIKCYHGNTIAYDGTNLYIAGAVDSSGNSDVANYQVFKVNPNNPSAIADTYTVLGQNIAIDDVTGDFYVGGGQLGSNPNKLYKYGASLENTNPQEISLEINDLTEYLFTRAETQGIAVHNGTLYQLFSRETSLCVAFNAASGELIRTWNIPYVWNGCKYSQELEDITYDPAEDRFLIMSSTSTQRTHNCQVANIAEVGLYKNVAERLPRYAVYEPSNNANKNVDLWVENDAATVGETGACLPFYDRHPVENGTTITNACVFYNAYDAELYASMRGNTSRIHYIANARRTTRPVFSNWHPKTNFRISAASGNILRLTAPDLRRVDNAMITQGGSAGLVNIYATSGTAVLEVYDNQTVILENVELEPSTDTAVRGIDVYRGGVLRMLQTVQMHEDHASKPLYRVQTYGVIDNCRKLYDGAVSTGNTHTLSAPAYSTGIITIEAYPEGQTFPSMIMCDRSNGNLFKGIIPVDGGYYACNFTIQQTDIRFNNIVYFAAGAATGSAQTGIARIIVRQYGNSSKFDA